MFNHILIPTDGSKLARKGVKAGITLAKKLGAKVTALYVMFPSASRSSEAAIYYAYGASAVEARKIFEKQATEALDAIRADAHSAGVRCTVRSVTGGRPWQAILRTARHGRCDLIAMASHGRSALGGLILGSETTHVLAKSKIPVLVVR